MVSGRLRVGDVLEASEGTVRVRGLQALGATRKSVDAVARVALELGGHAPEALTRGTALVRPGTFVRCTVVDVHLTGRGQVPHRPVLHCGSALVGAHARPLGGDAWRLTLERPLPLRIGDRAILRDPGSRALWGVRVLDPVPPALARRGAAAARARDLAALDGSVSAELTRRGTVRRSVLARAGVVLDDLPEGALEVGDWLVGSECAAALRRRLVGVVLEAEEGGSSGVTPAAAARALGLEEVGIVAALVGAPLRTEGGRITSGRRVPVPPEALAALTHLSAELEQDPFAAPEAGRLAAMGLDGATVALLHRSGNLLRLAQGVVLMPDAADAAVGRLSGLPQPFTASEARRALGTSRRVALPLLGHLDATGRTIRLPDDRRRVRRATGA